MKPRFRIQESLNDEQTGTEIVDGVYRFTANYVNWYLLVGQEGLTVVDAGLPEHWDLFREGLDDLGYEVANIDALVLTHADPDHMGFAERLRESGVPVWVHEADHAAALNGGEDLPLRTLRHLWCPPFLQFVRSTMGAGSGSVPEITAARTFTDEERLAVPCRPEVLHLPGHTPGHCALWVPDREVLFVGDALATMDLLRGRECDPALVELANTDDDQAQASVRELTRFDEITLLPGHGKPWEGHLGEALATMATE